MVAANAFEQTHVVTATALVNMTMKPTMGLTTGRDLTFGFVVQGVTSIYVDPITGGNSAAYFSLSAPPNTPVTVTFSSGVLSDGSNSIAFNGALSGGPSTTQNQSSQLTSGNTITTNSSGEYYFWAGGTANLSPTQPIGTYVGSFVLTIAY